MEHPPATAVAYNNIASVYMDLGKVDDALNYYYKSLAINETILGKGHPDTAISYNGIADAYHLKGDYHNALKYYRKDTHTKTPE